ncbi:LysR family transcriptional regulator [Antribacter sp. KLBMP9083]|uniref:LysR family transcriptional regulator n=1 Tax=Antribacter soli TaxID=2910976 RepID=A0AA41QG93_9MICO|nr:LysR family transcriptional regulator [Antribacter soli]MCF4121632.1 LysR family transcriptional regulator [Antribacter soli]
MNVELRHLRALAAIGDEGTITDAAAVLHLSQPALSRTLDQLEQRLGARLVERTTRSLALTDAGQRLWEHAHRILNQLDDALADVASHGPRPVRIGFPWAALGRHTVPLLRAWRGEHPDLPVRVRRCDDPEGAVRRGEVDAAFVRAAPLRAHGLVSHALYREPRVAAVADGDALAARELLHLADLADRPVALCATATTTNAELWPEGRRPHTFQVPGVDEWLTTIATGEAVGVTAEATEHTHPHPGVRYLPLADAPEIDVHLVWSRSPSHPATTAFVQHARQHTPRVATGRQAIESGSPESHRRSTSVAPDRAATTSGAGVA